MSDGWRFEAANPQGRGSLDDDGHPGGQKGDRADRSQRRRPVRDGLPSAEGGLVGFTPARRRRPDAPADGGTGAGTGLARATPVYDSAVLVDVETEIEINRSRADVAAYASDPDNATSWYEKITSVDWHSRRPVAVGSRIAFVAHFLGRRLAYTYEVKELIPGERFVMDTAEGPFPMETTYTWQDIPSGGTAMTLRNRGRPAGFSILLAPLLASSIRRANRKDLRRLKTILESPART